MTPSSHPLRSCRLGDTSLNPGGESTDRPGTCAAELQPVENTGVCWHRVYVEADCRNGAVWEIERRDDGGEYRILCNLSEVPSRRATWDRIRARFCNVAAPMCPDLDEPRVVKNELSFVVSHGSASCEVGKAVVRNEREAAAYGATVFEMVRKGRADDEYRRRLRIR
jgi:hypothetical protein